MIVTTLFGDGTSKSVIRGGHKCYAHRNGSFIEILYEKNGKQEWLRIMPEDVKKLLEKLPDWSSQEVVELLLEYDEDFTPEMKREAMVKAFGREISDDEIRRAVEKSLDEISPSTGTNVL